MSRECLRCGGITGPSGICLCCRGEMERTCLACGTDLPQDYHDYLCFPCGEAEGPEHLAKAAERTVRRQALRRCDDCDNWMYADEGPICPLCRWIRGEVIIT